MTENDRRLIERARKLHWTDSDIAFALIDQADTPQARRELKEIAVRLYHLEEAMTGNI